MVPATVIHAPETFSIEGAHRDTFLGTLYAQRWETYVAPTLEKHGRHTIMLDLADVKTLTLDAALVVTAEYWRNLRRRNIRPHINDSGWSPNVRALLHQLGFYKFVDASGWDNSQELESLDLQFVPFQTGRRVDGTFANQIINALEAAAGRAPKRQIVYGGLVEAMMNVHNHAYKIHRDEVFRREPNWWLAGAYDAGTQTLEFVAYDQGSGIPASIPRDPTYFGLIRRLIKGPEEADLIEAAIELGRSSTDRPERGNGMWTICRVAEELDGSTVRILSGRGEVVYSPGSGLTKKDHRNPFCGTLIQWKLQLPSETTVSAGVGL